MVIFDASHMAEAMGMLAGEHRAGLIVLDLDMHGSRPLMNVALLRDMWASIPLVVVSSTGCGSTIVRAIDLGVAGYVLKDAGTDELREAFGRVLHGQVYLPDFTLAV